MSATTRLDQWQAQPLSPEAAAAHMRDAIGRADEVRRTGMAFRRAGWLVGAAGVLAGLGGLAVAATVLLRAEPTRLEFALIDPNTGAVSHTFSAADAPRHFSDDTARQYLRAFVETCDGYAPTLQREALERQFRRCAVLMTEPMQQKFAAYFSPSNPASPQVTLGRAGVRTPQNLRFSKLPSEGNTQTWLVRYHRVDTRAGQNTTGITQHTPTTATVTFQWRPDLPQSPEDRTWNTAGMQVVAFTIEPDRGQ